MTAPAQSIAELYRDLHRHPELAFDERRTAGIAADRLRFDFSQPTALTAEDIDKACRVLTQGLEAASLPQRKPA